MTIRVRNIRFFRVPLRLRFPFQYGIASVSELPQLIVEAEAEIDGQVARGVSADGLAPKWFTKNPDTTFESDDLPAMLRVVKFAAETATGIGGTQSFFDWWMQLNAAQSEWAARGAAPPLLASFGVSLIERAVLHAVCCRHSTTLHAALMSNLPELQLDVLRPSLRRERINDFLPPTPLKRIHVRHTVGLGDPLTAADADSTRPDDGLPFTLEECLDRYGLQYLKIKLSGDLDRDGDRLHRIALLTGDSRLKFTLDGNENYRDISTFREHWVSHCESQRLRDWFGESLLFVEQPLHRADALTDEVGAALEAWIDAPAVIIDESDANLSCLPRALELGYSGTSHKNCKGIVKGVVNAATIAAASTPSERLILSGEDLINVGPVALHQDLSAAAALGIQHVERNGHHYLKGISMFPASIQSAMLQAHHTLYTEACGFPALRVEHGQLALESINTAPMGIRPLDTSDLSEWRL